MDNLKIDTIRKEVLVEASQQTAFDVFTRKMDLWWPRTHHIGKSPLTELVLVPGLNGRWYSKHEDGSEVDIGYIMQWNPHDLLVLAWQINGNFQFDPNLITEVEVRFSKEGSNLTRVNFEHKNLNKLGGGKTVESMDQGWGQIMELYKHVTHQQQLLTS